MNQTQHRNITVSFKGKRFFCEVSNLNEMNDFGREFTKHLKGGDVIALSGALGSGKTAFVKALAKGLGIRSCVTSPTFVVMNVYPISRKKHHASALCHIDAYRIHSARELYMLGAHEYIGNPEVITAIEWPERVKGSISKDALWVRISSGAKR